VNRPGPRVVSLVPSATETLLAWRIQPVAVTRFCEHPELAHVGGTKDPDIDAIVELGPDVVVMCREENRSVDALALQDADVHVHDIAPSSVDAVEPSLLALARAMGLAALPVPFGPLPEMRPLGLRAFVPIWRRPWMTMRGTTYGSSLLAALGVANVFDDGKPVGGDADRYPEITLDDAAALGPDVVLAPSEPYPFGGRHVRELEQVAPVVLVDGQDLFWWGVRTPSALTRLHQELAGFIADRS